jgi:hypothetical protein
MRETVILTRKQEPRVLVLSQVDRGQLTVGQERREDLIVDGVGMEQVQQHLSLCPRRVLPTQPSLATRLSVSVGQGMTQSLNSNKAIVAGSSFLPRNLR